MTKTFSFRLVMVLCLILQVFAFSQSVAFANPFTGNRNSPSPVRQKQPSAPVVEGQRFLHVRLGEYIHSWSKKASTKDFLLIMLFSFLYGVIHAIGPGHRKTVVFSFYITRSSHRLEPLLTSFVLAFSHGGVALLLALIFKGLSGAMTVNTNDASIYLEGFSFLLLIILSLFSIFHVVFDHFIKPNSTSHPKSAKMRLATLLLSGLYPCPAALLVLTLTFALNIMTTGVLAVLAMSAGMCVPITVAAYIAWAGRVGLFNRLKDKKKLAISSTIFELAGYVFLLFFSLYTSLPFILGLARRILA